jgi:hypothetical protein
MSDIPATANGAQGVGSVEVVTALDGQQGLPGEGQIGEIFDVTVTAKQSYGGQSTAGHALVVPGNTINGRYSGFKIDTLSSCHRFVT